MTPLSVSTFIVVFSLYISDKQCYDFRIFTNSFGHQVPHQWGFPCLTSNNSMDCSIVPSGFILDKILKNSNKEVQDKTLRQLYKLGQYHNPEPQTNRFLSSLNHRIPLHGSPSLRNVYSSPNLNLLGLNSMKKLSNTRPLLGRLNGPSIQNYQGAPKITAAIAKYENKHSAFENNINMVTINNSISINVTRVNPMALEHDSNITLLKVTESQTTIEYERTSSIFKESISPTSPKYQNQPSIPRESTAPMTYYSLYTSNVATNPMFQEYDNNLIASKEPSNAVIDEYQNNISVAKKQRPEDLEYGSNALMTKISPVPSENNSNTSISIIPKRTMTSENEKNSNTTLETRRVAPKYNYGTSKLPLIYDNTITNNSKVSSTSGATILITALDSKKDITDKTTKTVPKFSDNHQMSKQNVSLFETLLQKLEELDRKFYKTSFAKLLTLSPEDRRENGISFAQSGFLLYLMLLAVSTEVDPGTRAEIDDCIDFTGSDTDRLQLMKQVESWLPIPNEKLKLRWSTRLALFPPMTVSRNFETIGQSVRLNISHFNGTESPEVLANTLNHMIELDSGGAMHDTFEDEELSGDVRGVLMSIAYMRGRWRSAPTLLNGTRPFHDANTAPQRATRMIRINDAMRYADLNECDAEAVEISYATEGLSLLMLIPRGKSLRSLAEKLTTVGVSRISRRMYLVRMAVTIPLYTLRMTLLLPSKLRDMGIKRLVTVTNSTGERGLVLSHAIQRLMFWSEAGRNAFKDDGMEWDEAPEMELVVDRPYLFFVRWHNVTLMNGNFVL